MMNRRRRIVLLIFLGLLFLTGVLLTVLTKNDRAIDREEQQVKFIILEKTATEAIRKEYKKITALDSLDKVFFRIPANDIPLAAPHRVFIDLQSGAIYVNVTCDEIDLGLVGPTKIMTAEDKESFLGIFEKYCVVDWKRDYLYDFPSTIHDGAWSWEIRFADKYGNIDYRGGGGEYRKAGMTPKGFDEFMTEVFQYFDVTPYLGHDA